MYDRVVQLQFVYSGISPFCIYGRICSPVRYFDITFRVGILWFLYPEPGVPDSSLTYIL